MQGMKRLERDIACIAGGAAAGILATGLAAIFVSRNKANAATGVTVPGTNLKGLGAVGCIGCTMIPGTALDGLPGVNLSGLPGVGLNARTKQTSRPGQWVHWRNAR